MIYLCHKCTGVLQFTPEHEQLVRTHLYHCRCMSGYVREWQKPERDDSEDSLIQRQIKALNEWLALYAKQGRDDLDQVVQEAKLNLQRLQKRR